MIFPQQAFREWHHFKWLALLLLRSSVCDNSSNSWHQSWGICQQKNEASNSGRGQSREQPARRKLQIAFFCILHYSIINAWSKKDLFVFYPPPDFICLLSMFTLRFKWYVDIYPTTNRLVPRIQSLILYDFKSE